MPGKSSKDLSEKFDDTETIKRLNEIKQDIIRLLKDLQYTYDLNPNNQKLHELKLKSSLANLEAIDCKLFHVYNSLTLKNEDDLASNYGISVKLEIAQEKLDILKEKHSSLNKEWHSQDEHLNKISENIYKKEEELKAQSILCTVQGLTLGKILWKLSKDSKLLEIIVSNEKLAVEVIKIYSGCLYGFVHTFQNDLPDPKSDEYQFVLCLTGIFNNLATIPDGRFFLLHQSSCREVLDQIIKTLPFISVSKGEDLKFLTLSIIYNVMICQEGVEFMQNNSYLIHSLKNCIDLSNSERIILMGLKVMANLLENNNDSFDKLDSPIRQLLKLDECSDSSTVRKYAKEILEFLQEQNSLTGVETVELVKGKTKKRNSYKESCNSTEEATVTCYTVTETNVSSAFSSKNQTTASEFSKSVFGTSLSSSSSSSSVIQLPNSPLSKCADLSISGSEPTIPQTRIIASTDSKSLVIGTDNEIVPCSDKSISCNMSELLQEYEEVDLVKNLNLIESKEIQNLLYQFPYTNVEKTFSITIGDNFQNPRYITKSSNGNHSDGENINSSIVTVYRTNNSHLFAVSENSFFPFIGIPQCSMQTKIYKATQALSTIINQEYDNLPTTSKFSTCELEENCSILSNISSNEDAVVPKKTKLNKQSRNRESKKKRNSKSKIPVFQVSFRRRKCR